MLGLRSNCRAILKSSCHLVVYIQDWTVFCSSFYYVYKPVNFQSTSRIHEYIISTAEFFIEVNWTHKYFVGKFLHERICNNCLIDTIWARSNSNYSIRMENKFCQFSRRYPTIYQDGHKMST